MSRVSIQSETGKNVSTSLEKLAEIGPRLVFLYLESGMTFIENATNLWSSPLSRLGMVFPKMVSPCEIPETNCPPRCACSIEWDACRGEKLKCTVRVTNTSSSAHVFHFTPTPFQGPGNPKVPIHVAPSKVTLKPKESVTVTAGFTVTDEFQQGHTYRAELLLKAAYEQCVCIELHVGSEQTAHCEVEQGDPPTRIRAHHWYDHFQCEESCEPISQDQVKQPRN